MKRMFLKKKQNADYFFFALLWSIIIHVFRNSKKHEIESVIQNIFIEYLQSTLYLCIKL